MRNSPAAGRFDYGAFVLLLVLCGISAVCRAEVADPQVLVDTTIETLRAQVNEELARIRRDPGYAMDVVANAIEPHMDVKLAGRLVLGRHWLEASEAQRAGFVDGLRRLLLRVFALHISDYTDAEVTYSPTVFSGKSGQRAQVRTRVSRNGSPAVPVDYRLHRADGAWKVYDVAIFGVSIVRTYHLTIDADVRERGLDSVIEQINAMSPLGRARTTTERGTPGHSG